MDAMDKKILYLLSKNPRMAIKDIARRAEITRNTVRRRLKNIFSKKKAKITVSINVDELTLKHALVMLSTKTFEFKQDLIEVFSICPRVIFFTSHLGSFDIVFIAFGKDSADLEKFLAQIIYNKNVKDKQVQIFDKFFLKKPSFVDVSLVKFFDGNNGFLCESCPYYEIICSKKFLEE
ncbi:MAG: Lrp/AsnC family transcriptional regulator [Candidatus Asgardarchaeia archaeon]